MGKFALALTAATLLLPSTLPLFAQTAAPPVTNKGAADLTDATNRIVAYSAWDDDFLYLAFQVNKPTISAKNNTAFSHPLEDDAVIISLQTDNDRTATKRTDKTITIVVSAGGGTQIYLGTDAKPLYDGLNDFQKQLDTVFKTEASPTVRQTKTASLLNSLIKSAVTQKGAMRAIGTPAAGYTVELAVPWSDLGGRPQSETRMGFNLAAQSVGEGSPALQSLSAGVKSAEDVNNPSLWEQIVFRNAPAPFTDGLYISPRIFGGKPEINGELSNNEWNGLTRLTFGTNAGAGANSLPATFTARVHPKFTPRPASPAVPLQTAKVPIPAPHTRQAIAPLVLAQYTYWYQGDSRKSAPAEHVWQPNGLSALAQHPLDGVGPWLSYDRADWHRQQLIEARRAGIDVILPVYRGGIRDRQRYADKGLLALATALQALQTAHQDYPQVGLYLDTTSLPELFGTRPDLHDATVIDALYDQIHDFYRMIPAQFRCSLAMSAANGGRVGYPVFLSDSDAFKGFDATFAPALRAKFAADFDGADLLIIGESGFAPQAGLDGYFGSVRTAKGTSFAYDADGWIKTATIGAGFDTSFTNGDAPIIKPRMGGDTYRTAWKTAVEKAPDWALIDGWNDFSNGANLAPSVEIGYAEDDQTKIQARRFAERQLSGPDFSAPHNSKFLYNDVPANMAAGHACAVHVRAQNAGSEVWNGGTVAAGQTPTVIVYRWLQNDKVIVGGDKIPLSANVGPGENADAALAISTNDSAGNPLSAGDYTLEIGAAKSDKKGADWNSANGDLKVPVHIGGSANWAATLIRTDLPRILESGGVYSVTATIRNDSTTTWRKADGTQVALRLFQTGRVGTSANTVTYPFELPVDMAEASVKLTQDVLPGQEVNISLLLPLMDAQGIPLPLWTQNDSWTYTARWEVASDSAQTASEVKKQTIAANDAAPEIKGVSFAPTPLAITLYDFGAKFTSDGTPPMLPGQKRLPVRLSLTNKGPQAWKADSVRVGYHWYYADGTEFLWEDETTPLISFLPKGQTEVQPGQTVTDLLAYVTAPPYDGTYTLVWDVKVGDTWASTTESSRVFDELVRPVKVLGGKLVYVDLTKAYNVDGITDEDELTDGNLDGNGKTLPALLTPPFADMTIAPAALWLPTAKTGPESPHRIGFRWGPKESGANNFIACRGQRVELGKTNGTVRLLHIIAASTGKDISSEIQLVFQEPSSQSQDAYVFSVSAWDRPPTGNDEVAFVARNYHDRKGTQSGALAFYHYIIKIRDPRNLVAVILPNEPDIKIAAVTLEK